ncbi:MAG TPA: TatD family hydrolase [Nevskiales bacterium]|nr:TatD family hydrolase [Nevskiales bacterium]
MSLIDIGANLAHDSFDADRDAVLVRARQAGVSAIIVTGSDLDSARKAVALARAHAGFLYATAGQHPHHAGSLDDDTLHALHETALAPQVVATGEMGLDFFRDFAPRPAQERAFQRQLEMAVAVGKPVFLHQRDAHARFLPILCEQLDRLPAAVVHCFTGTREELYDYLDVGLHVGITGWICDERRGQHLLDCVRDIPLDRLMLETDAPYLLPRNLQPKPASRRNEPAYLPAVLATVAQALGRPAAEVAAATTATARRFFRLA